MQCVFSLQTCYEMERYLRDEPKLQSLKKLPSDMEATWFATPTNGGWKMEVDCLDDFSERHLDSLSTSSASSACSWDSALSCAVLVKQVMFSCFIYEVYRVLKSEDNIRRERIRR